MRPQVTVLLALVLTACFEPVRGDVSLGASQNATTGNEHTLRPWVNGGVALIEGPNGADPDHTTFPKHIARITELACTAPCELVSGPAADASYVVRAARPGTAKVSGLVTLDNGERHQLEEELVFVDVTALQARCVEGACPGPMAQLVGATSVWAVTGTGTTSDGGVVEVTVDEVSVGGENDAVSVTRLPHLPNQHAATMLRVDALAKGSATLSLQWAQGALTHEVRVVDPLDVTQLALRPARTSSDFPAWSYGGKTIDETATLEGPLTVQRDSDGRVVCNVALVGTTSAGQEVLGNAQALEFMVTWRGPPEPGILFPERAPKFYTSAEFSNWGRTGLDDAKSFTVTGHLGTATATATLVVP